MANNNVTYIDENMYLYVVIHVIFMYGHKWTKTYFLDLLSATNHPVCFMKHHHIYNWR